MKYTVVNINYSKPQDSELIIAWLSDHEYLGVEEKDDAIVTYSTIPPDQQTELNQFLASLGLIAEYSVIEEQNWNALWESNFEPVIIPGRIHVRAHFHQPIEGFEHEIKITPKMSFGTGHHATTKMMMLAMLETDFKQKTVIDFGAGTGILAILAEQLGAVNIQAIDNDPWCVENATENIQTNLCRKINVSLAENLNHFISADIILANINKNVLVSSVVDLFDKLNLGGVLILSGLLSSDYEEVVKVYSSLFKNPVIRLDENGWIALVFVK